MIDPAAAGTLRHRQEPDHLIVDDTDRRAPRGNETSTNPLANSLVGVNQRRTRHEFPAGAAIDLRDGLGVIQRGHAKTEHHYRPLLPLVLVNARYQRRPKAVGCMPVIVHVYSPVEDGVVR